MLARVFFGVSFFLFSSTFVWGSFFLVLGWAVFCVWWYFLSSFFGPCVWLGQLKQHSFFNIIGNDCHGHPLPGSHCFVLWPCGLLLGNSLDQGVGPWELKNVPFGIKLGGTMEGVSSVMSA